jgi:mannosyltransferase
MPRDITSRYARTVRPLTLIAFGSVIAFGCVLRFWKLSGVGLWYDELWTVVGASNRPFGEMYREWMLGDSHPPGFFLFYFAWLKLVPPTEFWTRLPSALAGVLTVAYLLFGTTRVLTRNERVTVATLVSLSYVYVLWALTVKQYSFMLLLVTVATITYLEILAARRVDRRTGITLTAAVVALAYLNHFGMIYAAMLLALLLLNFRDDSIPRRRVGRIVLVSAIAYLPIAPFLYLQIAYNIDAWQPYQVEGFLANIGPSLFFSDGTVVAGALVVLAAVLVGRVLVDAETRRQLLTDRNRQIAILIAAFSGFMIALGVFKPIFYIRYFLSLVPAVMLALGILTAAALPLDRGWAATVLLVFFVHAATVQFRTIDGLQREQWDKSVDYVLESRTPADRVYVLGANMDKTEFDYLKEGDVDGVFNVRNLKFYRYYFRRRGASAVAAGLNVLQPTAASVAALAAQFHDTRATIYVLAGHHLQYRGEALATLRQVARRVEVTSMNSTLVYKLTF